MMRKKHSQGLIQHLFLNQTVKTLGVALTCASILGCGSNNSDSSSSSEPQQSSSSSISSSETSSESSSSSTSSVPVVSLNGVIINEVAATNTRFLDEDGDTPDWIELKNLSDVPVSLLNWSITDDAEALERWQFPDIALQPNEFLRIWASDKDRNQLTYYRTLVSPEQSFQFNIPDETTPINWNTLTADVSEWPSGMAGFGFGDQDDVTVIDESSTAVFFRRNFQLENPQQIEELTLHIDYDDGFVAYINGHEIARVNMANGDTYDALATGEHEATWYQDGSYDVFKITDLSELNLSQENVFAVQVHNATATSSDISAKAALSAAFNSPTIDGTTPDNSLNLLGSSLHTNFKISSSGESLFLFNAAGELADQLDAPMAPSNVSVGRSVATQQTVLFETPTPGEENALTEYFGLVSSAIEFSHGGGVLSPSSVMLSGASDAEFIRYTTDASIPTDQSPIYQEPILIESNQVIRARVFRENYFPSEVFSRSFLSNAQHDLPVITLIADPLDFFDVETGIYALGLDYQRQNPNYGANFWQDWERPVQFSFYDKQGNLEIHQNLGVKIFGGWSRANAQKSLALFARDKYGPKKLEYPFFAKRPYTEFKSLVLRNSGNDWMNTMLRDVAMTSLMDGSGIDTQAHLPVAVYLNQDYWGLYNLREKINEDYLAEKYDIDKDDIDLLEGNASVVEGTNEDYLSLVSFLENNSLAEEENFQYVDSLVDIDNFTIYQIAQIYFNNTDWPGNNIKFWKSPESKWRWILYDTDFGFGIYGDDEYENNTLAHALALNSRDYSNPPWATLLLRSLLTNDAYRTRFINRFADELNSRFLPSHVHQHIDALAAQIAPEIPLHIARWEAESSWISDDEDEPPYSWEGKIEEMKEFAALRPNMMRSFIADQFDLEAIVQLTIDNSATEQGGSVLVNRIEVSSASWSGYYFTGVPTQIVAQANPGYVFSHWVDSEENQLDSAELTLDLGEDTTLFPVFTAITESNGE